ncbi:unnamed protein product [Oppiella nova]|uniref:Sodium-dependent serotonin transporter n=1 Tax=Oppiella nova TaxID=334625 RepID=A0A7R9LBI9_9ACAR|nr:unnamed protein product [Oppiella nova]CAG2161746.1 unnamed protein product [Oppiella nova]
MFAEGKWIEKNEILSAKGNGGDINPKPVSMSTGIIYEGIGSESTAHEVRGWEIERTGRGLGSSKIFLSGTDIICIRAVHIPPEIHSFAFRREVLEIQRSDGIDSIGAIKVSLALCLMMVFILVYFSLWKGVKSTGKAVWVTALMPYFVLFILLIRGVTLEGSMDGIKYYLSPSWDKLYSINVWIDAATQIFFSLGPGFGTLMALSSYNKFHNNCYRDAIFTSTINCLTSFMAGFVIFSVLGYMAHKMDKDISDVAAGGPGLVFIVYPEAIATMHGSVFWSILFFVMLITLGLDSTFGGLEAMITGLCDEFPSLLRRNREIFVAFIILFVGVMFSDQIQEMLGMRPGIFWRTCWKYISPFFLGVSKCEASQIVSYFSNHPFIFFAALFEFKNLEVEDYVYPNWSIFVGWLITLSSMCCIPFYAIYKFISLSGSPIERFVKSFKPESSGDNN